MTLLLVETLNSDLFPTSKRRPSVTGSMGGRAYLQRWERTWSKTGTIPGRLSVLSHYAMQMHPQWDVDLPNLSSDQGN